MRGIHKLYVYESLNGIFRKEMSVNVWLLCGLDISSSSFLDGRDFFFIWWENWKIVCAWRVFWDMKDFIKLWTILHGLWTSLFFIFLRFFWKFLDCSNFKGFSFQISWIFRLFRDSNFVVEIFGFCSDFWRFFGFFRFIGFLWIFNFFLKF